MHNFRNDFLLTLSESDERVKMLKEKKFDELKITCYNHQSTIESDDLILFIHQRESRPQSSVNLQHTKEDLMAIIKDITIKDNAIFVSSDEDQKITGVAFVIK